MMCAKINDIRNDYKHRLATDIVVISLESENSIKTKIGVNGPSPDGYDDYQLILIFVKTKLRRELLSTSRP